MAIGLFFAVIIELNFHVANRPQSTTNHFPTKGWIIIINCNNRTRYEGCLEYCMKWEMGTVDDNENDISLCINDRQTNHVIVIDQNAKMDFLCTEWFLLRRTSSIFRIPYIRLFRLVPTHMTQTSNSRRKKPTQK